MDPKPGIKTSEAWYAGLAGLLGIALASGWLTPGQSDQIVVAAHAIAGALIAVIPIWKYIESRIAVKTKGTK